MKTGVIDSFCFLGTINKSGPSSQEMCHNLTIGRAKMKEPERVKTRIRIVKNMTFPVNIYRCENWTTVDCKENKQTNSITTKGTDHW